MVARENPSAAVRRTALRPRTWVAALALAAVALLWAAWPQQTPRPENVILMVVDTLRADHLGVYGYGRDTSPALDALARESTVFLDVTSQAPWTTPAITSLLTSLYPSAHGILTREVNGKPASLARAHVTLAEALSQHGWQTAAFMTNPWLRKETALDQGFGLYEEIPGLKPACTAVNGAAGKWLDGHGAKPFFLYLHYMDVHGPYEAPAPYDQLFPQTTPARVLSPKEASAVPTYLRLKGVDTLDGYVAAYDRGIRFWDDCLAEFMGRLKKEPFAARTTVIVVADHGEEFLEHGGFNHGGTLFQEQVHVPLVWWNSGARRAVRHVETPVKLIDIPATILDLLGLPVPQEFQGHSLLDLMEGGTAAPSPVFAEAAVEFGGLPLRNGPIRSVRLESQKVIENVNSGRLWLYDLASDPREQADTSVPRAEAAAKLRASFRDWMDGNLRRTVAADDGAAPLDPSTQERLRALGYADDGS